MKIYVLSLKQVQHQRCNVDYIKKIIYRVTQFSQGKCGRRKQNLFTPRKSRNRETKEETFFFLRLRAVIIYDSFHLS